MDENAPQAPSNASNRRHVSFVALALVVILSLFRSEKQVTGIQEKSSSPTYTTIKLVRTSFDDVSSNNTSPSVAEAAASKLRKKSNSIGALIRTPEVRPPTNKSVITINHQTSSEVSKKRKRLRPCQILVKNEMLVHLEVIESVAKLIPYEYLSLPNDCNHQNLQFEFFVREDTKTRPQTWLALFNDLVSNTFEVDNSTGIRRSFGTARQSKTLGRESKWDTTIQASCVCREGTRSWLRDDQKSIDAPHICIHHSLCNWTQGMDNAIYMSPHHKRYFVPSALPQVEPEQKKKNNDTKLLDICTIGSTGRRKWKLVTAFLEDPNNTKYFDKIRIRMLGNGGMPKLLKPFLENKNTMMDDIIVYQQLDDDRMFYAAIQACGMIILPIAKDNPSIYQHYFKSPPNSMWKLSGSIPPIIAYQKPFVLPQELLELYHKELPLHLPHRGYDDEINTGFAEALSSLLDELLLSYKEEIPP